MVDSIYAASTTPEVESIYTKPTTVATGVSPHIEELSVTPAVNFAVNTGQDANAAFGSVSQRVMQEGLFKVLAEQSQFEQSKRLEELKQEWKNTAFSDPSAAPNIAGRADELYKNLTTGVYSNNDVTYSTLEALSGGVHLDANGRFQRALGANELAAYMGLQQAAADLEAQARDNPISSFVKSVGYSLLGGPTAAFNWDLGDSVGAAINEHYGVGTYFDSTKFSTDFWGYVSRAGSPKEIASMLDRLLPELGGPALNQLAQISELLKGHSAENHPWDAALQLIPPVGYGTAVALVKGVSKAATPGAVLSALSKTNKQAAAATVLGSLDKDKLASAVVSAEDAVRASFSVGATPSQTGELFTQLSKEVQEQMVAEHKAFIAKYEGITPTTLTEQQKLAESERIVALYTNTDKSAVKINILSTTDEGAQLEVLRNNGYSGKNFATVEEAHAYAAAHSIPQGSYEVIADGVSKIKPAISMGRYAASSANLVSALTKEKVFAPLMASSSEDAVHALLRETRGMYKQMKAADDDLSRAFVSSYEEVAQAVKSGDIITGSADNAIDELAATYESMIPSLIKESKESSTMFAKSGHYVTPTIGKEFAGLPEGVQKIWFDLGMRNKLILMHEDDVAKVAMLDRHYADEVLRLVGKDVDYSGAGAWHTMMSHPKHGNVSIILMKKSANKEAAAFNVAHEVGHAFFVDYLMGAKSKKTFDGLVNAYKNWSKKTQTAEEFAKGYNTLRALQFNKIADEPLSQFSKQQLFGMMTKEQQAWYKDFEEFFVEQFATHMLGKPKVRVAFFDDLAKGLKAIYDEFAKVFGTSSKAIPTISKFLDDHMQAIKEGKLLEYMFDGRPVKEITAKAALTPVQRKKEAVARMMAHRKLAAGRTATTPAGEIAETGSGYLIREVRNEPYLMKDVGVHDTAEIAAASKWGWLDPKQKITQYTYNGSLAMQFATGREKVALTSYFKDATKGLSGKEQKQVFDVLSEIDSMSNAGNSLKNLKIDTAFLTSKGLGEKQIKMYMRVRDIRDFLWTKHNNTMVKELKRDGYSMRLVFSDPNLGMVDTAVHVYPDSRVVKGLVGSGSIKKIYDLNTKQFVVLDAKVIDDLFTQGKQIAKMKTTAGEVRHVIIGGEHKITPLSTALPYRPHEFSRIYSEDYFITYKTSGLVDGVEEVTTKTFRTAANAKEAVAYTTSLSKVMSHIREAQKGVISFDDAARLADKELAQWGKGGQEIIDAVRSGEIPLNTEFSYHFDRVKEDALTSLMDEHLTNGRMFESERGRKLLSVYEDRNNILSPVESLGVEMSVVTKKANMSDWRKGTISKYLNTFVDTGSRTGDDVQDFLNAPIKYAMGTKEYAVAKQERNYIQSMINGRSVEEKEMAAKARLLVEDLEQRHGLVGAVAEKVFTGMQLRKANPLQFLRTINFHLSLGMFNPSQLMVQSMGMMNSMMIHPVHGLKAAYTAAPLRMALMSDNPEVWRKLAHVGKAASSEEEFVQLVQAVRKSGVLSTVKNTALYNNTTGFDNIFKEYGTGAFGKASTFFFDRGEEFSRLVSWDVARREWMAANKGVDWTTTEAINAITGRMDDYTMGMTAANIANYQRGIMSIPAQFLQYNIKLATEVGRAAMGNGRALTRQQAGQILLGNLIMFGTAGNGLRGLADEMFGESDKVSADQKLALTQGAIAALLNEISDGEMKLAVGSRLGTFNWYGDTITKIANGNIDIPDFMFGITKSNFTKSVDVLSDVAAVWHPLETWDSNTAVEGLRTLASVTSGFSNANKAYVLTHNGGRLYNKRGDLITTVTEQEAYAQILGIQPAEVPDFYYQLDLLSTDSKDFKERVKTYQHLNSLYLQRIADGDFSSAANYRAAAGLLLTEDPLKASALIKAAKGNGGIPVTVGVATKLQQRALEKPVTSTNILGE